jgi:hypothetical protein
MPSSTSTILRQELPAEGEKTGQWDDINNLNLQILEAAIAGTTAIATTGGSSTLTNVDYTNDQAKKRILDVTGALVSNATIVIPNASKTYIVLNRTTGSYTLTIKTSAGSGIEVTQSTICEIYCDGSNTCRFATPMTDYTTGAPATSSGAAASSVSVSATGNLSSTNAQAALAELQGDIDTINTALGTKQAFDTDLSAIAALSNTKGNVIIGGAAGWTSLSIGTNGLVLRAKSAAVTGAAWGAGAPATTVCLFYQSAAPTGWTIGSTGQDDRAIVINNSSGGGTAGGTVDFSTAFASKTPTGTIGGTALTEAQLPSHYHYGVANTATGAALSASNYLDLQYAGGGDTQSYLLKGGATAPTLGRSSSVGSGDTHTHTFTGNAINLAVKYLTMISASADA